MTFQAATALAFLVLSLIVWCSQNTSHVRYLPGPKPEFFFGNARQVPKSWQWLRFAEWSELYGKLIYL